MRPLALRLARRWLALANLSTALFLALPFLAPVLLWAGRPEAANAIYAAYQLTCHEWPFRAYFLFGPQATYSLVELQSLGIADVFDFRGSPELGFKVAFCARNVAIYAAVLLAGLAYARRRESRPLSFTGFALLCTPMAVDGLTQLVGWRESTWELRTLTGLLFGAASVWLIYPRLDELVAELSTAPARSAVESPVG